jgi:hypothetical protein
MEGLLLGAGAVTVLAGLGLVSLPLYGTKPQAQEERRTHALGLEQRVAALEKKLAHVTCSGNNLFITGANLHICNGKNATETVNGLGNLIVSYHEQRNPELGAKGGLFIGKVRIRSS